jgi:uncharacterized membrane protein
VAKNNNPDKYKNPGFPAPQITGQVTQHYESAYLPASEAERYEQIHQGFIGHLMQNVDEERRHRHLLELKANNANVVIGYIEASKRILSPIIAGSTILAFAGIVFYGFKMGHPKSATTLAGCLGGILFGLRWLESKKSNK